ncbi:hypothetical protein HUJ05_002113 [Dendroctonus ponderosae]|nr:hypothetical protein HUJ05_002113 [Dendroctonus ponderosae]
MVHCKLGVAAVVKSAFCRRYRMPIRWNEAAYSGIVCIPYHFSYCIVTRRHVYKCVDRLEHFLESCLFWNEYAFDYRAGSEDISRTRKIDNVSEWILGIQREWNAHRGPMNVRAPKLEGPTRNEEDEDFKNPTCPKPKRLKSEATSYHVSDTHRNIIRSATQAITYSEAALRTGVIPVTIHKILTSS